MAKATEFSPETTAEIARLYRDKTLSLRQLAVQYGVDRTTIVRFLKTNGIEIRESRLRSTTEEKKNQYEGFLRDVYEGLDINESATKHGLRETQGKTLIKDAQLQKDACKMYIDGKNVKQIALELQVGVKKINKALRIAGIEIERRPPNKLPTKIPPEERKAICSNYRTNPKGLMTLAGELGYSTSTVKRVLEEGGIQIKPQRNFAKEEFAHLRAEIAAKYKEGASIKNLKKEYRLSHNSIYRILSLEKIEPRSQEEIAELYKETRQRNANKPPINKTLTSRWRKSAQAKQREWALTDEYLNELWVKQNGKCHYTGLPIQCPTCAHEMRMFARSPYLISLDRIDSSKDYIPGNVVFCCASINLAKRDYDVEVFRAFLSAVATNLSPKLEDLNPSLLHLCA